MANRFELRTMNGSVVIAKIAGMKSIANMMSVVSTTTRTANSGVAMRTPLWRTKKLWPWYSSVIGTARRTSRSTKLAYSGLTSVPSSATS